MSLDELRLKIDSLDENIISLLEQRMSLSSQIADIKRKDNIPVLNEKRENEIKNNICKKCNKYTDEILNVYDCIFTVSKDIQNKIIK